MHQDTVRQEDHVQVPPLALATAKLTVTHAHILVAIPVEALCVHPTVPIDPQNSCEIPMNSIRHQDLLGLLVVLLVAEITIRTLWSTEGIRTPLVNTHRRRSPIRTSLRLPGSIRAATSWLFCRLGTAPSG